MTPVTADGDDGFEQLKAQRIAAEVPSIPQAENFDDEDSSSQSSLCSDYSILSGHYEADSSTCIDHQLSGRWAPLESAVNAANELKLNIDLVPESQPSGGEERWYKKLKTAENILTDLTLDSYDTAGNSRQRFLNGKETYVKLDEVLVSTLWTLLVCIRMGYGKNKARDLFFCKEWEKAVTKFVESIAENTFSRETFETRHKLDWVVHTRQHYDENSDDIDRSSKISNRNGDFVNVELENDAVKGRKDLDGNEGGEQHNDETQNLQQNEKAKRTATP